MSDAKTVTLHVDDGSRVEVLNVPPGSIVVLTLAKPASAEQLQHMTRSLQKWADRAAAILCLEDGLRVRIEQADGTPA